MGFDMETTWDGLPISKEKPHGAAIVVYKRTGAGFLYLTLHRGQLGPDFHGDWAWGSPSGSRLPGESVPDCVARELREESGLELAFTPTGLGDEDWLVCLAEAPHDAVVTLSNEHDRFEWLPARQAAAISLPPLVGEQILGVAKLVGDPAVRRE